jgi:hypothetical protein
VFDDLAVHSGLSAQRIDEDTLVLDGSGIFIYASGYSKGESCSCNFEIWTTTVPRVEEVRAQMLRLVRDTRLRDEMFVIDWQYRHARGGLMSVSFEEMADPMPLDKAYPSLVLGVGAFVERYLNATETVLILQGPPGTGKTRLVRAVQAAISKRKQDSAQVIYTADQRALHDDEIFVDFVTGKHVAFVIEDAHHLLKARTSGNVALHRFLSIADGVVRAQGRKVIFTTNLPNLSDLDDALLRPGPCFAAARIRLLDRDEAAQLANKLCEGDEPLRMAAMKQLEAIESKDVSVAHVYRACDKTQARVEKDDE